MTHEESLHKAVQKRGGRLPRSWFSPEDFDRSYGPFLHQANGLIDSARAHVPRLPNIHFDFVVNGRFNAFTFKADGEYFIGFSTGAKYLLGLLFCRMLSDPNLFEFIGDPSEETTDLPPLTDYATNGEHMFRAGILPTRPKNHARWSYASALVHRAFIFLVGHEIAHITRGHVDYLLSKEGEGFIPEVGWTEADADASMERQALEADADCRSTVSAIDSAHLTSSQTEHDKSDFMATRISLEDLLFDWAFAMNTVFRLLGDLRFSPDQAVYSSYPPPPLRRLMATRVAHICVVKWWDASVHQAALKALKRAAVYSELAFMKILGKDHGGLGLEAFGMEGVEYHGRLSKFWTNTLWPRVAPFAYEKYSVDDAWSP